MTVNLRGAGAVTNWRSLAAAMSETAFRAELLAECEQLRLAVKWDKRPELSTVTGWPDLVIIGPRGVLYRELKTMRGTLSPEQRAIGARLLAARHDWQVWRPAEWWDGTVDRQLTAIRREKPDER